MFSIAQNLVLLKNLDEWVDRHGIKSSELCMLLDNLQKYKEEMEQRLKEADFIVKKISDYCFDEPDTYFACTFL